MTKDELSNVVAEQTGYSKRNVEVIVNSILETIIKTLSKGDRVSFIGFGTFEVRKRGARVGVNLRNPKQKIKIPAMKVPKFKPGKTLKEAVK